MNLNYYEAEWLTKFKLKEAMRLTRKGLYGFGRARRHGTKPVDFRRVAPALTNSGSPC